jgi:hypothetical protein
VRSCPAPGRQLGSTTSYPCLHTFYSPRMAAARTSSDDKAEHVLDEYVKQTTAPRLRSIRFVSRYRLIVCTHTVLYARCRKVADASRKVWTPHLCRIDAWAPISHGRADTARTACPPLAAASCRRCLAPMLPQLLGRPAREHALRHHAALHQRRCCCSEAAILPSASSVPAPGCLSSSSVQLSRMFHPDSAHPVRPAGSSRASRTHSLTVRFCRTLQSPQRGLLRPRRRREAIDLRCLPDRPSLRRWPPSHPSTDLRHHYLRRSRP